VGTTGRQDLGSEVLRQLWSDRRALFLAAAILLVLALIPGFPWYVFVALSADFPAAGYWYHRHRGSPDAQPATQEPASNVRSGSQGAEQQAGRAGGDASQASAQHRIVIRVGPGLGERVQFQHFDREAGRVRQSLAADLGLELPTVGLRVDQGLAPHHFKI